MELLEQRRMLALSITDDTYVTDADTALHVPAASGLLANDAGPSTSGTVFHVSASGSPAGNGSALDPWDLQTALDHPSTIQPGDTIILHGGTYVGNFTSRLVGTASQPILVRATGNEHVKIDMYDANPATYNNFNIEGGYTHFQGFEILSSDPSSRQSSYSGSWPEDVRRGQIEVRGDHIKLINMVIHDLNKGVGFWSSGEGGEIYGSIIYNNGWLGTKNPHGHGIYSQNSEGLKRITDNIIFNPFMLGIQIFGSAAADLNNYHVDGNVIFNAGGAAGANYHARDSLLIGGGAPLRSAMITGNQTYHTGPFGTVSFGFNAGGTDLTVTDNYFHDNLFFRNSFQKITFAGNHAGGMEGFTLESRTPPTGVSTGDYVWNNNEYVESRPTPFKYNGVPRTFQDWRSTTGWDTQSTIADHPSGTEIFITPNRNEAGSGHAVVFNWDDSSSVDLDLSNVVPAGASYEIYNVLDLGGPPVGQGVNHSGTATVPMIARPSPRPIGHESVTPITVPREFATFIIKTVSAIEHDAATVTTSDTTSAMGATVSIQADGSFTYDPSTIPTIRQLAAREVLVDRFEYTATGASGSKTATVTIDISGQNEPPTAADIAITTNAAASTEVAFSGDDIDNDNDASNLFYAIVAQPTEGVVTLGSDGRFTFDPAGDFDDLPSGGSRQVRFDYRAIDASGEQSDPATVTVTVTGQDGPDLSLDFGDASQSYPTLLAEDGARHVATGPVLGANRDSETDGSHSDSADADDIGMLDDEDGVMFGIIEAGDPMAGINIELGGTTSGRIDAWLDFAGDGTWDASDQILRSAIARPGLQTFNFVIPPDALSGETYARVRVSSVGGLAATGLAADGEVEDYLVTIVAAVAPQVESVQLNHGDVQRSNVTSATLTFNKVVTIDDSSGDPFQFIHTETGAAVVDEPVVSVIDHKTIVTFAFVPGTSVEANGSLIDGSYRLVVDASRIHFAGLPLDGSGDGIGGDDYTFAAVDGFFRKFGDAGGNGVVDLVDFAALRAAFGSSAGDAAYRDEFDVDGDNEITLVDFSRFRENFGT